ncbi:glycosyltransferase [Demetria terragena]|uniref:glycosyltransferase n=1 Tax=Demetria terragena TaxID=63959 RepID=UPI000367EC32|nr:glycosyltransferase [Demetria terragena]
MTDLVVISLEPWDQVWRRNQHLMDGLLRADATTRVLFVEPGTDPVHDLRRGERPRRAAGLRQVAAADYQGRLWCLALTKWLPRKIWPGQDQHWAQVVLRAARELAMDAPVLWVNDPRGAQVLRRGVPWRSVYDITDDWLSADRAPRERERLIADEKLLLDHADDVVVCSSELLQRKGKSRPVHLIPNAIDGAAFAASHPRPADLPPNPCAVYLGTLHRDRLDVDLCVRTARALGQAGELVLVGPDSLGAQDRDRLRSNDIQLLGARPHDSVPAYLQHADVLVVPHLDDDFTASLDPIKRYEYAASGRPTIATPVAGFTDGVDGVRVAAPSDFPTMVAALAAEPPPRREPSTAIPTWVERVAAFQELLPA